MLNRLGRKRMIAPGIGGDRKGGKEKKRLRRIESGVTLVNYISTGVKVGY